MRNLLAAELAHAVGWWSSDVLVGPAVLVGLAPDGEDVNVPDSLVELARSIGLDPS